MGIFLWTFGFTVLSSNLSTLTETHLGWPPAGTSAIFLSVGAMGICRTGYSDPTLAASFWRGKAGNRRAGVVVDWLPHAGSRRCVASFAPPLRFRGRFRSGLRTGHTVGHGLKQSVEPREQGRVQGGNQSVQALARVVGPLVVALLTINLQNLPLPYVFAAFGSLLGIVMVRRALPILKAHQDKISSVANGLGGIVAGFALGWVARRLISVVALLTAFSIGLLARSLTIPAAAVVAFGFGMVIVTLFVGVTTLIQIEVPDAFRGRVLALYNLAFSGLTPFGALALGLISANIGVLNTFLLSGALSILLSAIVLLRWPGLWQSRVVTQQSLAAESNGG